MTKCIIGLGLDRRYPSSKIVIFVYKPESRLKGLHDSFSNLLSWLRVPSYFAEDISTGEYANMIRTLQMDQM